MSRIMIILSSLCMVLLFQNCQKTVSFGSDTLGSLKSEGDLIPLVSDDDDDKNDNPDNANGEIVVDGDGNSMPPAPPVIPPVPGNGKGPEKEAPSVQQGNGTGYICILDGPGKSVRLGVSASGQLQGQNPIPRVLCMSREACLNIVSAKFNVKGPHKRGFCKANGNPHVIRVSDAEMAAKILE